MSEKELFGGNMAAVLPTNVIDISEIRQVPDNQEVFVHAASDQSLTVELLSRVDEPDEQALRTHYEDVGKSNDAIGPDNCRILSVESLPTNRLAMTQCTSAWYLLGQQVVSKFNESASNVVQIHLGFLRLPAHGTDVVVTLNDPIEISAQSSSAKLLMEGGNEDLQLEGAVGGAAGGGGNPRWSVAQFRALLTTLRLVNPDFLV